MTEKSAETQPKASFDVWLRWADILAQRMATMHTVYQDQPPPPAHLKPPDIQNKPETALTMLQTRVRFVLDGAMAQHLAAQPYAALQQAADGDDKFTTMQIQALAGIFRDALTLLPTFSADMQRLLNSRWQDDCNGRQASDLFRGPVGTLNEGIGSGSALDGRLPGVLAQLLTIEATGAARAPRQTTLSAEEQQRWQDTAKRWATMNSRHLRSAGRMD
jgi:hypothetical protein